LSIRLFKNLAVELGLEAADSRGRCDQDRDVDEAIQVHEMSAQRLLRDLFLITVPAENLFSNFHEEPAAGTNDLECRLDIQGMSGDIVCSVGDFLLREELPRLGTSGSAVSQIQPHSLHGIPPIEQPSSRKARGLEGYRRWAYRS